MVYNPEFQRYGVQPMDTSYLQSEPESGPGFLASLFAKPGFGNALMAVGMNMMAQADRPGNVFGALGRALPAGQQAMQQAQQRQAIEEASQGLPPSMQALLPALGDPTTQGQALWGLATQPPPDMDFGTVRLADGRHQRVVNGVPVGDPFGPEDEVPDPTSAQERFFDWWMNATPEQRAEFRAFNEAQATGPDVSITMPGLTAGAEAGAESDISIADAGRDTARTAAAELLRIEQAEGILEDPGFFAGRGGTIANFFSGWGRTLGLGTGEIAQKQDTYLGLVRSLAASDLVKYGSGSGLSDADLKEVKANLGADVALEPEVMRNLLTAAKIARIKQIAEHNEFMMNTDWSRYALPEAWRDNRMVPAPTVNLSTNRFLRR